MKESEAIEKLKNMRLYMQIEDKNNDCKFTEDDYKANEMAIQALEKQITNKADKTEITLSKRKFATELKQLVHQKCAEINHYVSGCNSPFSYLQIADVQESLRKIENTLNIKIKE